MERMIWQLRQGEGPIVAAAIHHGHQVRPDVAQMLALSERERLHEEDPFTGDWTVIAPTSIVALQSRFQVDLNRPREKAVYRTPEDAWGLHVWKHFPARELLQDSLAEYDAFYEMVRELLTRKTQEYGRCVVLDLHSYNHRRAGIDDPGADPEMNPDVNIGTGTMDRQRWGNVVDRFIADLKAFDFLGQSLDVRENVNFRGGYFPRWIHEHFPETVCAIAIEVKKFFMDEWTGELFPDEHLALRRCLEAALPGICEELTR